MRIQIDLDELDPPAGTVQRPDGDRLPFEGWLGLLRVLSEELGDAGSAHRTEP